MDVEEESSVNPDNIDPSEIDDYSELPPSHPLYVEGIDDEDEEMPDQAEAVLKIIGLIVGLGVLITFGIAAFVALSSYSALIF